MRAPLSLHNTKRRKCDEGAPSLPFLAQNLYLDVVSMVELNVAMDAWKAVCLVDPKTQIDSISLIVDGTDFAKEDFLQKFAPKLAKFRTKYYLAHTMVRFDILSTECGYNTACRFQSA